MRLAAIVASVFLPAGAFWANVEPSNGKLVVWGPRERGPLCAFLTVDPASRRSSLAKGDCASRQQRFTPRTVWDGRTKWSQVRVGGRVVLRYRDSSTGRPQWAFGGGKLWLYDVGTPRGPQLLRFSARTGRLERRIRFPVRLFRPVLAANAAGAWLMAATNGGSTATGAEALYHATNRVAVVQRGARAALWMTVHGRTLWVETVVGLHTFRLWRYDGEHGRVLWTRRSSSLMTTVYGGGTAYGGGALWGIAAPYCAKTLRVLRIDVATGAMRTVERQPLLDCNQYGASAFYRGSFWFVDGDRLFGVATR